MSAMGGLRRFLLAFLLVIPIPAFAWVRKGMK